MAYDEYRERHRMDREEEFGRGEYRRPLFGRGEERRWPGESSWGYGPEYDEGYPEQYRSGARRSFEGEGRPETTRGASEFHPETTRRYVTDRYGRGFGWQPEGGYGQGAGYLYGWSPGEQGFESRAYRTPERWRTELHGVRESWRQPGYYGTSRYLARIPRGPFTGRGPKGYQRSDERIREDVSEELAFAGDIDAGEIEVHVTNCVVTLDGEVETRDEKRFAEDIAEAAPGVRDVHNNLRVKTGVLSGLSEEEKAYSTPKSR
jgi:osmotically-inducible protein OsmY